MRTSLTFLWLFFTLGLRADSVVVFNELMYHPLTNEAQLEWMELHNQMAVDVDLSGWALTGGIEFKFPSGTVMAGGGYLVIAASPAALMAATGAANVLGPYLGRLSNAGETLNLRNNNERLLDSVTYGVEGDWPVGPDGGGVSLAKRNRDSGSAAPENWSVSAQLGGTPGTENFPRGTITTTARTLVPIDQAWRYDQSGANLGIAWRAKNFDDSAWTPGPALLGVEGSALPEPLRTVLTIGRTNYYFRTTFNYTGNVQSATLALRHIVDDGLVVYLNGAELWRMGMPEGSISSDAFANRVVDNAVYEGPFTVPASSLVSGANVLAVEVHQQSSASTDIVLGLQLDEVFATTNTPAARGTVPLAFNELASATNADFWVEFINQGPASLNLEGFVLARMGGATNRDYILPAQTLAAGELARFTKATLGFGADPGDRLILYPPERDSVIDAVVAKREPRGRSPDAVGRWLFPTTLTPAASNHFVFRDELVINEILYHPRVLPPVTATFVTNRLLNITDRWKYHALGQDLGTAWRLPAFDDSAWSAGPALLGVEVSALPEPLRTSLTIGRTTYYFRTTFNYTGDVQNAALSLRHLVDDGMVVYLNGTELWRVGMAEGTVAYGTLAGRAVDNAVYEGPFTVPAGSLVSGTNVLAVEVHQQSPDSTDVVFGAELTVLTQLSPAQPWRDSPESWVELFNRSSTAVDLAGWRLDEGIDFRFADGTTIAPGGYLVVAKDVAHMRALHPGINVVGPFTNKLSKNSDYIVLKDPANNPADEVRYFDGGRWPGYPDGGGSSLELRDPWADNSRAEAWAASVESSKTGWSNYVYRAVATAGVGPTLWNEFVMGLLDAGECLIDDVSVVETPGGTPAQFLQNTTFENGLTAWRALGNHRHSRVIVDPDNAANHVLHLIATGATEHMHNHLETTFTTGRSVVNGREYEISFRAKWLAGDNQLNTRLYFNRVAKTTSLRVAALNGSPGVRNSTYEPNIGPTFADLRHSPAIPPANGPVAVTLNAADPQGITTATLRWSANSGPWQSAPMTLTRRDASSTDLAGTVPGFAAGTVVQFYAQATDGLGASATFPAQGTNSRALYIVQDGQSVPGRMHQLRVVMTPSDANFLFGSTNVMSNDRMGCTVFYDENEVFYDVSVHLQGSERGRLDNGRVGYTIDFHPDRKFRGVQAGVTVDRSGGYSGIGGDQDEVVIKHMVQHAGGLPGMYDDLVRMIAPRAAHTGPGLFILAKYGDVFLESQYPDGSDGTAFKLELIYYPTTTLDGSPQSPKIPNPDDVIGADLGDLGDDLEAYRWLRLIENNRDRDDYAPMIALSKAFSLANPALQAQQMDVDQWMRAFAFQSLVGIVDSYSFDNAHNFILYFRPEDGRAVPFLWDMDFAFVAATSSPLIRSGGNLRRIIDLPANQRLYYGHLLDFITTTFNATYMTRWVNHYGAVSGQNYGGLLNYITARGNYVLSQLPLATPFSITNNAGNNFTVANASVTLGGTAPLTVRTIQVNGVAYPVTWTSLTAWRITVPLSSATNLLVLRGVDGNGNPLANLADTITVTTTGLVAPLPVVINEWMAGNGGPGGLPDALDGAFQDWFELFNPNDTAVNLSGFYLTDTLSDPTRWQIPAGTLIPGRGFLLVWADNQPEQNGAGTPNDLHAAFALSNDGETIGLYSADGFAQHIVVFGQQIQNVSEGLFPDGNTDGSHPMTNWTPRAANRLGLPSPPAIGSIQLLSGGAFSFRIPALPDRAYLIEYKDALDAPVWTPLSTNRAVNGGILFTSNTGERSQRFYRVMLLR